MRPYFAAMFVVFAIGTMASTNVYESRILVPTSASSQFGAGEAFFRIDGSGVDYSVWIVGGAPLNTDGALHLDSTSAPIVFADPQSATIHGCDTSPINPYIFEQRGPIEDPFVTCPALQTYHVFSGRLNDTDLAMKALGGEPLQFTVDAPPWGASSQPLHLVPEPSSWGILLMAFGVCAVRSATRLNGK